MGLVWVPNTIGQVCHECHIGVMHLVHASPVKGLCIGRAMRVNEKELASKRGVQLSVMFVSHWKPMSKLWGQHTFFHSVHASQCQSKTW